VEYDAVLVAGCPPPAPDALPARDAKAGAGDSARLDPRVVLLLEEAFRHAKALGAWGTGLQALEIAGIPTDVAGVATGSAGPDVLSQVQDLMGAHRTWERFATAV
jgi:catalase